MQAFRVQSLRCLTLPARTKCHTLPEHYHHSLSTNPLSLRIRSLHIPVKPSQSLQRVCSGSSSGLPPHCRAPLTWQWRACYCSSLSEGDLRKRVEEITALFFEARELLDDARSSANTVYFNEDLQEAQTAVEEALREYEDLLGALSAEQRQSVVGAIGLKVEELKAQLAAIKEELDDS